MGWIIDGALRTTLPGGMWIEIGVALGKGTARMARTLIDAKRDDVQLYAVDPWAGTARNGEQQTAGLPSSHGDWALFLDTMQRCAPEELRRIHVLRLPSHWAAACLGRRKFDLCIIDAAHDYESVKRDIAIWRQAVRPGGVLAGDDHEPEYPGVQQACEEQFGVGGYEWERRECNWGTWRKVMP
jgi:predicted O-methyltransferase YrrM